MPSQRMVPFRNGPLPENLNSTQTLVTLVKSINMPCFSKLLDKYESRSFSQVPSFPFLCANVRVCIRVYTHVES